MQINNTISNNLQSITSVDFIDWQQFREKTFFVTGATGLIGYTLVSTLLFANKRYALGLQILALVRNEQRARERFVDWQEDIEAKNLLFILGSVEQLPVVDGSIDYIVHGASSTKSRFFVEHPVETMLTAIEGTKNTLELAREKNVQGYVYLSSMEVYGYPLRGQKVTENMIGTFSPLEARNSYPLSKVQCESLCYAFAQEYSVPTRILRLTQTYGTDVNYDDNRIFAYFWKCVAEHKNIVLKTKGETERSYLHVYDAATAILILLQKGKNGEAYNVADETTYCSIAEMARKIAKAANVDVIFNIEPESNNGFPNALYMDLDTSKLQNLGWLPKISTNM